MMVRRVPNRSIVVRDRKLEVGRCLGGFLFASAIKKTPILFFFEAWSNRPDHAFFMRQLESFGNPKRQRGRAEWRGLSEPTALAAGFTSSVFRFEARG